MRRAAIRVDGDAEIGIGHLRRCLVLARALAADGWQPRFVRWRRAAGTRRMLSDFPTLWLEDVAVSAAGGSQREVWDADVTLSLLDDAPDRDEWVVVDHYGLARRWEKKVRETGRRVLAIDDFRGRRHSADVLVSDSQEPFEPGLNENPAGVVELVGLPYALVDAEFAYSEARDAGAEAPARVLVTFGGSDPTRETAKALSALRRLRERLPFGAVDVVVGPANPLRSSLERRAARLPQAAIHVAPPSLAPWMRRASLVITSGGNTLVEALALRKPCLVVMTADNQRRMVEQLRAEGLIRLAGPTAKLDDRGLAAAIAGAVADLHTWSSRVRERSRVDHLGAGRIVAAMRRLVSRDAAPPVRSFG